LRGSSVVQMLTAAERPLRASTSTWRQRPALVDPLDIQLPVDRFEHLVGQPHVVERAAIARQEFEVLAAGLEIFEHAGLGGMSFSLLEIMVQAGRFGIPIDHQHWYRGIEPARQ
jgi:hypothetical protein